MWFMSTQPHVSYQHSVTIEAPAEHVWSELIDVERWPESTVSMTSVERLDPGPFQLGSRARIKQPKFPPLVWTVTDSQPRREFTWRTSSPGATTIATHVLTPGPGNAVTVSLSIARTGLLAGLLGVLTAGITRKYVDLEAAGLKRVCEASAVAA
jgi:uncharacterized membrane protein